MTPALAETLSMVAQAAEGAIDPWWVIGSAAIAVHGHRIAFTKDVDLMMSARDAEAFLRRVGARPGGAQPSDRFNSQVFGIWNEPPIPVEIFGGFRVATGGKWREVALSSRERVSVGSSQIHVPSREELISLLHAFGRPKDMERATLLKS